MFFPRDFTTKSSQIARSSGTSELTANDSNYNLQTELKQYMQRRESQGYQIYPGTEPLNYDFSAERHNLYATNLTESSAHLIKGCLGVGVLSIHVGFMYAGLWTALVATMLIGILVSYTMMMVVTSAHKMYVRLRTSRLSYPDLAEVAVATGPWTSMRRFSKPFRYFVEICLFAEMCCSCCIYQIMIARTVKQSVEDVSSAIRELDLSLRYYIVIVALPLIILCLIRNLKYLAPFSVLANVVIGLCVLATTYYSLNKGAKISERPIWKGFHGLFRFCGVCLYSIDGVAVIMPVENNMKNPKYFVIVLQCGMTIATALVMCTGFFGYWGWGEKCRSPITIHMPLDIVPTILQFLLIIMLSVTFALHFWVPFRVVWYYIGTHHERKRGIWERFYRLLHVSLITCVSVAFPNLIRLMIFVGNFFVAFISFILPAIIESMVTWKEPHGVIRWVLIRDVIIFLVGIFFCCGAFYASVDIT